MIHFDTDSIENYFVQKLNEKLPTKADKILNHIRRERDGNLRHRNYDERGKGKTQEWEIARQMFDLHYKKLGFETSEKHPEIIETKTLPVQQTLF